VEAARELAQRVHAVVAEGRFLALITDAARYQGTAKVLGDRFGLAPLSLEQLLLQAMHAKAKELRVDWPVVLDADAASNSSREWMMLGRLASVAAPAVQAALASLDRPTLLLHPGTLARYGLLPLLQPLQELGRRGPAVVVLVAGTEQDAMPLVDREPLPVVNPSDWARVPRDWHRVVPRVLQRVA
jgi:hypothetical protein